MSGYMVQYIMQQCIHVKKYFGPVSVSIMVPTRLFSESMIIVYVSTCIIHTGDYYSESVGLGCESGFLTEYY